MSLKEKDTKMIEIERGFIAMKRLMSFIQQDHEGTLEDVEYKRVETFNGKIINTEVKEKVIHPELEEEDLDGLRRIDDLDELFFENSSINLKEIS